MISVQLTQVLWQGSGEENWTDNPQFRGSKTGAMQWMSLMGLTSGSSEKVLKRWCGR